MEAIKNLLVGMPLCEQLKEKLRQRLPGTEIAFYEDYEAPLWEVQRADVLFGNVKSGYLRDAPRMRWVQLASAGSDPYIKAVAEDIPLTNGTGAYGPSIGEHMLGMTLALMKHFPVYRDAMKTGNWLESRPAASVLGCTCLSVGMGDLGGNFASRMKALGAYVIGVRRADLRASDFADELHLMDELDELLPRADVVALSLPNSPQTVGLMNARRLALMKQGAILINVGRGSAVDSDALCEALHSGHLGGAGLDVTEPEPLPPEHPLWREPNALITPHTSGGWVNISTQARVVDIFLDNLDRFERGEPLKNLVDRTTGYRESGK